jgi:hypothetical protein
MIRITAHKEAERDNFKKVIDFSPFVTLKIKNIPVVIACPAVYQKISIGVANMIIKIFNIIKISITLLLNIFFIQR